MTFIIAEVAQAHEGSLGIAFSYIDALSALGIDAVKFQMHIAEAESSLDEPFRVNFAVQDDSRFAYWSRTGFTFTQWKALKNHCDQLGVEMIISPFSLSALRQIELLGVQRIKLGSGEIRNRLLLEEVAKLGLPTILSVGLASHSDIQNATDLFREYKCELTILQCTTEYPVKPENLNLAGINALKKKYTNDIGYSDHSGHVGPCIAAVALGAKCLEFHVTFDKRMFGPDAAASLTLDEIGLLVKNIRILEKGLLHVRKPENFDELQKIFGKSLSVNRDMRAGEVIQIEHLETKKPNGAGIDPMNYHEVIGKQLTKDIKKWSFLTRDHLNEKN